MTDFCGLRIPACPVFASKHQNAVSEKTIPACLPCPDGMLLIAARQRFERHENGNHTGHPRRHKDKFPMKAGQGHRTCSYARQSCLRHRFYRAYQSIFQPFQKRTSVHLFPSFTEYERRNKSGDENIYYIERTFSQLKFQEF